MSPSDPATLQAVEAVAGNGITSRHLAGTIEGVHDPELREALFAYIRMLLADRLSAITVYNHARTVRDLANRSMGPAPMQLRGAFNELASCLDLASPAHLRRLMAAARFLRFHAKHQEVSA